MDISSLLKSLGIDDDFSGIVPEDISAVPQNQWVNGTQVIPPPAIERYLASGDILTDHTIDMMELAMEKAFGVKSPWYISSLRDGTEEDGNLSVSRFVLQLEVSDDEAAANDRILQDLIQPFKNQ
jgi:hypothetical protein